MASKRKRKALKTIPTKNKLTKAHNGTDASNSTIYQPLDTPRSIRLLNVSPCESCRNLKYTLETTTIDAVTGTYYALSYVWGPPGREKTITVNGQKIRIRRSLFSFLKQLDASQWKGALWVDAVCIDQSVVKEKNHQVQMMHEIYAAACQVLVWLGQSSPPIDRLFDVSVDGKGFQFGIGEDLGGLEADDIEAILEIVRKPYWNRIWIVQELIRAREVVIMCGTKHLKLAELRRLVGLDGDARNLFYDDQFESKLVSGQAIYPFWRLSDMSRWHFICNIHWDYQAGGATSLIPHLSYLIHSFGHMDCHDGHDRVYALLGLLDQSSRALIDQHLEVDYGSSMVELFILALRFCRLNNEETQASDVLDLIVFLKLQTYCSEMEAVATVTSSERYLGTINALAGQATNPLSSKPLSEDALFLLYNYEVDDWMYGTGLRWHETTVAEKALIDSTNLQPEDVMYRLCPAMESLNVELRPANYDDLVIVVRLDEDRQVQLLTVGIIPWSKTLPEGSLFNDLPQDFEKVRLLRWRQFFEEFLRNPHVELSVNGQYLDITSSLNNWIALSKQLLEEASLYDPDYGFSARSMRACRNKG